MGLFTKEYTPDEIRMEIAESGLKFQKLIPVESFGWIVKKFGERSKDPGYMEKLLGTIRSIEGNEDLVAMSPHIIAVAVN